MKLYTEVEVKALILAFQRKYNDLGCDGLPYFPKAIEVDLVGYCRPANQELNQKTSNLEQK